MIWINYYHADHTNNKYIELNTCIFINTEEEGYKFIVGCSVITTAVAYFGHGLDIANIDR